MRRTDERKQMRISGTRLTAPLKPAVAAIALSAPLVCASAASDFATPEEARALLTKAVAAVKANKSEALARFNSGADGFKDRDLYVFCIGPDWIGTAGPVKGGSARDLKDKNGKMLGEEFMRVGKEGQIAEVEYVWPRPGTTEAIEKVGYVTKVDDQVCGVGYYK
jgi:signal transduction histidine kinase